MAVTKQAVRPLPGGKKVKQFNDIKKHQLTFLTCNDCFFVFVFFLQNIAIFLKMVLTLMQNNIVVVFWMAVYWTE